MRNCFSEKDFLIDSCNGETSRSCACRIMCNFHGNSGWIARGSKVEGVSMTRTSKVGNGGTRNIKISLYKITDRGVSISVFESQTYGNWSGMRNLIYCENGSDFNDSSIIIGLNFIRI